MSGSTTERRNGQDDARIGARNGCLPVYCLADLRTRDQEGYFMTEIEWLESRVLPPGCALVVVDVQNDYCHDNGALNQFGRSVSDIRRMVPRLKEVVEKARQTRVP